MTRPNHYLKACNRAIAKEQCDVVDIFAQEPEGYLSLSERPYEERDEEQQEDQKLLPHVARGKKGVINSDFYRA